MRKLILHCIENYAYSGENYIFEQVLNSEGFDSFLLSEKFVDTGFNPVASSHRISFRRMFRIELVEKAVKKISWLYLENIYLWLMVRYFKIKLKSKKPDVLHVHFGHVAYRYLGLAKSLNIPMVVTFYGVDATACTKDKYWIKRLQLMFEVVNIILVLNDEAANNLIGIGCPKEKIKVWDIGIPIVEYPYRQPRSINENDTIKFLIVARFVEKKGHLYLLEAFSKLVENIENVRLTIVGHGPLKSMILSKIELLNIKEYVDFIDTSSEVDFFTLFKETLISHDIFVLPSVTAKNGDEEGTPIVISNAMAVGLPVISTPIGGIERAIENEVTGYLVEPNSSDDLFKRMYFLSKNTECWNDISIQARDRIEENFDKTKQLKYIDDLYNRLMDESIGLTQVQ